MRAEIVELGADRSGQRLLPRVQTRVALNSKRFGPGGLSSRSSCIASWDVKNLGRFGVLQPLSPSNERLAASTFEITPSEPKGETQSETFRGSTEPKKMAEQM